MTSKYHIANAFQDGTTRLVIPDISILRTNILVSLASSLIEYPKIKPENFFFFETKEASLSGSVSDTMKYAKDLVFNVLDLLTIGLGVTKIETNQDYVMPFSKGIGSTGEIIHLLGARNEIINLEFKTDRFPGRLGYVIKRILQKIFEDAMVVYVIDDLLLSTPCLIRKMKLSKEAKYRGAVMGELELVSLATGSSFASDLISASGGKLEAFANVLKLGAKTVFSTNLGTTIAIGSLALSGTLINDIIRSLS